VFQDNPFAQVNPNVLNVFTHDPILAIGMKNIETEWINQVLGADYLQKLKGRISVCYGTTMGSPEVMWISIDAITQSPANVGAGIGQMPEDIIQKLEKDARSFALSRMEVNPVSLQKASDQLEITA
jgi:hypothetical protein